jgi:hypothetical protein
MFYLKNLYGLFQSRDRVVKEEKEKEEGARS